jgi:hypothetical protein
LGADTVEGRNMKAAEALARRLRTQDHHVVDDCMLVPCALRGLQLVGRLNLTILAVNARIEASARGVAAALSSNSEDSSIASLSTLYCSTVMAQQAPDKLADLKALVALYSHTGSAPPAVSLGSAGKKLRGVAGSLLIDLSSSLPTRILQYVSEDPVWHKECSDARLLDNILPQPAITQVGEHVLSIVQEMEGFCSSAAQSDFVAALGSASLFGTAGWSQLRSILSVKEV